MEACAMIWMPDAFGLLLNGILQSFLNEKQAR